MAELLKQYEWSHLDLVRGADALSAQASGTIAEQAKRVRRAFEDQYANPGSPDKRQIINLPHINNETRSALQKKGLTDSERQVLMDRAIEMNALELARIRHDQAAKKQAKLDNDDN